MEPEIHSTRPFRVRGRFKEPDLSERVHLFYSPRTQLRTKMADLMTAISHKLVLNAGDKLGGISVKIKRSIQQNHRPRKRERNKERKKEPNDMQRDQNKEKYQILQDPLAWEPRSQI